MPRTCRSTDPDAQKEITVYVFESTTALQGGAADTRLSLSHQHLRAALYYVAALIAKHSPLN